MQRFEIYRSGLLWVFVVAMMLAPVATAYAQAPSEPVDGIQEPVRRDSGSPGRSLVWTGSGDRSLDRHFPEAAVWLEVAEDDRVLGLLYPEARLPARGAVVVLSDEGETAASGVTSALAKGLAARGWAVLTLGLESPSPALQQILTRPAVPEPANQGDADTDGQAQTESMMIDVVESGGEDNLEARYRNRVDQALEAGLVLLVEQGYEAPALLGVGRAGIHVTNRLLEGADASALVWVAPRFYPVDRSALPERLESLDTELLELYPSAGTANESDWSLGMTLRRTGMTGFHRQPVSWVSPPSEAFGDAVASRVAAWLESR